MIGIVKLLKRVPLSAGRLLMGMLRGAIEESNRCHHELHMKHPWSDEFGLVWRAYFSPLTGGFKGVKKEIKSLRQEWQSQQ